MGQAPLALRRPGVRASLATTVGDTPLSEYADTREVSDSAIAMLDDHGTVVGWTQAAERLDGYSPRDVVGRSASLVVPPSEDAPTIAAYVEGYRAQDGGTATTAVRSRDGRLLNVSRRVSMLR
ncbi:PAS domain S-box protein [Streptomyces fagopyri]|uniref:PAS domain S-box protein n=1 Tax=Streptomyces fagopyri TaxID=2662397 RepID=UPI00382C3AAE